MARALRLDEMRDVNTSIEEVVPSFVLYLSDLESATAEQYGRYVRRFASWLLVEQRDATINNVEAELVDAFLTNLGKAISPQTKKPYSSSSRRYAWQGLQSFGTFLSERNILRDVRTGGSVLATVRCPKLEDKSRDALTPAQLESVFAAAREGANGERNWAVCVLLATCGLRRDELIGLNIEDIDFDKSQIHVRAETSKFNKERYVTLYTPAAQAVDHYLYDVRPGPRPGPKDPLFLTDDHARISESALKNMSDNIKTRTSIDVFCLHQLRHTFASNFKQNDCGEDSDLLREAGWNDLRMLRRYSHDSSAARVKRAQGPNPLGNVRVGAISRRTARARSRQSARRATRNQAA